MPTDAICEVRRGQFFYEAESTSFPNTLSNLVAAGGSQELEALIGEETGIPSLLSNSNGGTDTFAIGSTNLTSYPIGIPNLKWDNGYTTAHALGLGKNSTYLNSLVQAGQIASRVWSIFWGRMWVDDWLNGSIVLGGYDSALVTGDNYTQALDYSNSTGCYTGMKVIVTDVVLNNRDGTDVSIMPANYALPVCLVPQRQLLMEGPATILSNFYTSTDTESIGGAYGASVHWSATRFLASNS